MELHKVGDIVILNLDTRMSTGLLLKDSVDCNELNGAEGKIVRTYPEKSKITGEPYCHYKLRIVNPETGDIKYTKIFHQENLCVKKQN